MQKLLAVTLNDLRITFRERGIWLNLVVIPIALVLLIAFANSGGTASVEGAARQRLDVIDNDNSALSAQFLADIRALDANLVLCPMDNDAENFCQQDETPFTDEQLQQRVIDNVTQGILVIPAGLEAAVQAGEPVKLIFRAEINPLAPSPVAQTITAAMQRLGGTVVARGLGTSIADDPNALPVEADKAAYVAAVGTAANELLNQSPITVSYQLAGEIPAETEDGGLLRSGMRQSVPGMGTMYVMFTALAGTVLLLTERKQWTMQRLIGMPVARWQVMGGKIFARFLMCMLQFAVVFGVGIAFGADLGSNPLALLLIMIAFSLSTTALAFWLATIMRSDEQAAFITVFLVITLAPLGGAWWPLDIVPEWMRIAGHVSPIAWAMDGFTAVIFRDGGIADVLLPVGVLLAFAAVFFALAVRRFKFEV